LDWSDHGGRGLRDPTGGDGLGSQAITGVGTLVRVKGVRECEVEGLGYIIGAGMIVGARLGARSCWTTLGAREGTNRARSRVPAKVEHVATCFCPCSNAHLATLASISLQRSHVWSLHYSKLYLFRACSKRRYG
jgi:hypothetical protein